MIKTGSDFSGVGAFDQALDRLGIKQDKLFACDWDKYARQTYCLNFGNENDIILSSIDTLGKTTVKATDYSFYFPKDVYERNIPKKSLDIYMTSPPCQPFSMSGKREGENSDKGVLFYNSHEFIKKNNPRYFIFENVKGLLSDDNGKTFQRWIDYLGGKSVNGNPVIFPHDEATPYHVYYQVMNAKHYGVPQNRERIFIIGIRDDADNEFSFPKPFHLVKRLKDVLETEVDEKYFLSDKMISGFMSKRPEFAKQFKPHEQDEAFSDCLTARYAKMAITDPYIKTGFINQDTQASTVFSEEGTSPSICAGTHGYANGYVETKIGAIRGRNPQNPLSRVSGLPTEQMLEINESGVSNALTTVQKDNVVVEFNLPGNHEQNSRVYGKNGVSPSLTTMQGGGQEPKITSNQRIRRLTPAECFRLMDFNEDFKWNVSDSQAYKQAGNSIVVNCLVEIIQKLKLT